MKIEKMLIAAIFLAAITWIGSMSALINVIYRCAS